MLLTFVVDKSKHVLAIAHYFDEAKISEHKKSVSDHLRSLIAAEIKSRIKAAVSVA